MPRLRKTIDFGDERRVSNIIAPMYGNHNKRLSRIAETAEAVKKINKSHAVDMCEGTLKMNFKPDDWHIACTYSDKCYAGVDYDRTVKDKRNFIAKLRRQCKKLGVELKYLTMTEEGVKSKKWHHHFVLPQEIPYPIIRKCWPFGQVRILNTLYVDGDFRGLAEYYVDKTKGGQKEDSRKKGERRFSFSLNCVKPKVTIEKNLSDSWFKVPRVPKGWALVKDSLYNGFDSWGNKFMQKYTLIKIDKEEKHERNRSQSKSPETHPQKSDSRSGRRSQKNKSRSRRADNQLQQSRHKR